MYKLVHNAQTGADSCVKRIADSAFIPFDQGNTDYRAYLAWLAKGNTPLPADPPPALDPKRVGIAFQGVMCSAMGDDQNGLVAVIVAYQIQKAAFQPTKFYFANGNTLTLTAQNIEQFTAVWMPFRQSFFKPEPT